MAVTVGKSRSGDACMAVTGSTASCVGSGVRAAPGVGVGMLRSRFMTRMAKAVSARLAPGVGVGASLSARGVAILVPA
eukprot:scaffold115279_cov47-Prasinocladus_malaysianus.AAC.2